MSITVNLELTDHCNLRCGMCSQSLRDEAHGSPMRFMGWDTWRAALRGLAQRPAGQPAPALCPHWLGEPTLHPHFDRFIEYAFATNAGNRLFREFKLHTNGVIFDEHRARLMCRLASSPHLAPDTFRFIHFSIDALSPTVYRQVKGADRQAQVYRNIERFLDIRHTLGLDHPHVTLAFVVQPENAHEAVDFARHWSASLAARGQAVDVHWDWPRADMDTLYFRPLNTADQASADRLHADVCRRLGLTTDRADRLRSSGSF